MLEKGNILLGWNWAKDIDGIEKIKKPSQLFILEYNGSITAHKFKDGVGFELGDTLKPCLMYQGGKWTREPRSDYYIQNFCLAPVDYLSAYYNMKQGENWEMEEGLEELPIEISGCYISMPITGYSIENRYNFANKAKIALKEKAGYDKIYITPFDVCPQQEIAPIKSYFYYLAKDIEVIGECPNVLFENTAFKSKGCKMEQYMTEVYKNKFKYIDIFDKKADVDDIIDTITFNF